MKNKFIRLAKPLLFIALLILLWQALFLLKIWPQWLFPSPIDVFATIFNGFVSGHFMLGILISLKRIFLGFGLSLIVGTVLGFLIAKFKLLQETLQPLILGLQTLPSICWLPLALLWFGLNEQAIIFVIIMGTVLSLTISVTDAVSHIPPAFINAGKMLGAHGFNLSRYIILPAILPNFLTGVKQGWSFAWRSLMSGEMLFITIGLGQLLMFGRELNDMAQVMAVMLIIIIIGVIFDQLIFGKIEKAVKYRWGLK
ncbi:MAG: ABC transporter permease [Patescibacteria group bacterium]|jgi:NitT/TauT family transport system permease protein